MFNARHKDQSVVEGIHIIHSYEYSDATARMSSTGFLSTDVGKVAKQINDLTWWILTTTLPTWVQISSPPGANASGFTNQVQFNYTGSFSSDAGFWFDQVTDKLFVSGAITSPGFSGSHTQLIDGTSAFVAGTNITIFSASNGQIFISAAGATSDPSVSTEFSLISGTQAIQDSKISNINLSSTSSFQGINTEFTKVSSSLNNISNSATASFQSISSEWTRHSSSHQAISAEFAKLTSSNQAISSEFSTLSGTKSAVNNLATTTTSSFQTISTEFTLLSGTQTVQDSKIANISLSSTSSFQSINFEFTKLTQSNQGISSEFTKVSSSLNNISNSATSSFQAISTEFTKLTQSNQGISSEWTKHSGTHISIGTEFTKLSSSFQGVNSEFSSISSSLSSSFVVLGFNSSLTNERIITQGTNITITDNGPGGTLVISAAGAASDPSVSTEFTIISGTQAVQDSKIANINLTATSSFQGINTEFTKLTSSKQGVNTEFTNISASLSSSFVVLGFNPSLTNERVITQGANITITDNGPGGTLVISAAGAASDPSVSTEFTLLSGSQAVQDSKIANITITTTASFQSINSEWTRHSSSHQAISTEFTKLSASFQGISSEFSTLSGTKSAVNNLVITTTSSFQNISSEFTLLSGTQAIQDSKIANISLSSTSSFQAISTEFTKLTQSNQGISSEWTKHSGTHISIGSEFTLLSSSQAIQDSKLFNISNSATSSFQEINSEFTRLTQSIQSINSEFTKISSSLSSSFVVLGFNPSLTNERVITQGTNITITDNGPGGTLVISAAGSSSDPSISTEFTLLSGTQAVQDSKIANINLSSTSSFQGINTEFTKISSTFNNLQITTTASFQAISTEFTKLTQSNQGISSEFTKVSSSLNNISNSATSSFQSINSEWTRHSSSHQAISTEFTRISSTFQANSTEFTKLTSSFQGINTEFTKVSSSFQANSTELVVLSGTKSAVNNLIITTTASFQSINSEWTRHSSSHQAISTEFAKLTSSLQGINSEFTLISASRNFRYVLAAEDLLSPNSSDWPVNSLASLSADSINSGLNVRMFDPSTEEGVGFGLTIPTGFTSIIFYFKSRAQSTPSGSVGVQPSIYTRAIPDNAPPTSWSSGSDFTPLAFTTNTYFQYDSQQISFSTLNLTASNYTQFELTRKPADSDDTLTSDWCLLELVLEFK